MILRKLLIASMLLLSAAVVMAQADAPEASSSKSTAAAKPSSASDLPWGAESLTVSAGYSPRSNRGIGKMMDRKLFLAQTRMSWVLWRFSGMTLRYYAELTPAAVITQPAENYRLKDGTVQHVADAKTNFAMGAAPIGLQLNFLRGKKLQPFVASNLGGLYFNRQTPVVGSQQWNFTFTFTGGVQIYKNTKGSWQLGYTLHHISNADAGKYNPGVDSNLFWLGYTFGGHR